MNKVELQKQQKQFIDMHNLALDRGKMIAKPTWTWFDFLGFMNSLDYNKIEKAFPGEGVWVGVEKNYPLFEKLWFDIKRCEQMVKAGDMPYEAQPLAYFTWADQGNYFYLKRMYKPVIEELKNLAPAVIANKIYQDNVNRKFWVKKLSREDGYFRELEELLETYSIMGMLPPTAKTVLIKFKENNPRVANIISFCQKNRSFTYQNGKGEEKIVDLDALRAAIKGRVIKEKPDF